MLANHDVKSEFATMPPRLLAVPAGRCFLGLPAHAAAGEAIWLQRALCQLLPRYEGILILLEEEHLGDDAGVDATVAAAGSPAVTAERATALTMARWQEVDAVRRRLDRVDQVRVQLAAWSHFADASFVTLWRQLLTAFGVNTEFRNDVLRHWVSQQRVASSREVTAQAARVACLREIKSLAMRLRVGELSGHHAEYGRSPESLLAVRLYAGSYAADGLTVEQLVGRPAKCVYRRLD